ncbi:MAG: hypothetical protein HY904_12625 [Deltaproteobacteria bacterium]|nr:hypothetical protein [Deltaproteobacteria bacterium]
MLVPSLVMLALAAAAPAGQAAPLPSVAVFRLNPEFGVAQGVANLMGERIGTLLRDSGAFSRVVASADLESLVDLERQKQMANCAGDSCIAEIAGVLGVDFLVAGSLGKLGGSFLINLKLLDVRKSLTAATISERLPGDTEEALLDGSLPAVRKLLERAGLKHALKTVETALVAVPVVQPAAAPAAPAADRPAWVFPVLGVGAGVAAFGGLVLLLGVVAGAATAAFVGVNSVVFVNYPVDLGKGAQRSGMLYLAYGALTAASVAIALLGLGLAASGGVGAVVAALKI